MSSQFTHLHLHTQYSLLDGAIRIKELPKILKLLEFDACAITDHGNLHGVIDFYNSMKANQLKPIVGLGAYVSNGSRNKRAYPKGTPYSYHLTLLCQNKEGYKNLIKLSSLGYTEGKYYGKPRIDHELLEKHHKGLIALSACMAGELAKRFMQGLDEEAAKLAQWYKALFEGRFYIELQNTQIEEESKINPKLVALAKQLQIPLVGTNNCFYQAKSDAESQYILRLMGMQKRVSDPEVKPMETSELYIKSKSEMQDAFQDFPRECLSNTQVINEQCEIDLENNRYYLPDYPVEPNLTLEEQFNKDAYSGLDKRLIELNTIHNWDEVKKESIKPVYIERLEFELQVILKMGFSGYFLIVADFCNWSKENNIPVGPGRGSGAGSLVGYSLGITDLDPLEYDLLFERFLNPDRVSLPDFDIDFETEGREKVIQYVRSKYGQKNVCQISSVGSLQAKGAIRGVARVMNLPYSNADKIAKLIPNELKMSITKAIGMEPELERLFKEGTEIEQKLIQTAIALEGMNSNLSTHAAGVIIMNSDVTDIMPVCTPSNGEQIQSQYTMENAENQGAVKFDFLGLRNLSIIAKAIELINANRREKQPFDIRLIPLDDKKTFQLLSKGDTTGVFQMESDGMKSLLVKMKTDCFEDIIALVALYRPGPLGSGMVNDYVERKHGRQKSIYPHPLMESVLKETYGVMVYQEQVMRTVQILAGFSLGEADILRRAIGKKKPEILKEQRNLFVEGCFKKGISQEKSNEIFDLIDKFAGYGFNKSHSAAYGLIGYQTAWLKANYPVDFMAALLTTDRNRPESVVKLIQECKEMNIQVLPPDINESELSFTTVGNKIRFGLNAIKNVGASALHCIIEARKNKKTFMSLLDVYSNINTSKVNARVLEALIKSGVFDSLESNRKKNFEALDKSISIATDERAFQNENQISIFELMPPEEAEKSKAKLELDDILDWNKKTRLKYEKEALGFYISGHPLDPYKKEFNQIGIMSYSLDFKNGETTLRRFDDVQIAGIIINNMVKMTKKNEKYSILNVEDLKGTLEVMVFPKVWKDVNHLLERDDAILIRGKVNENKEGVKNLVANEIKSLAMIRAENADSLVISLFHNTKKNQLESIKEVLASCPGECQIELKLNTADQCTIDLLINERVGISENLIAGLEASVGSENFDFIYKKSRN